MMFDTPEGIAFVRAAARQAALSLEVAGMKRRGRTAYAIVKEVYGFRGSKQQVLEDLNAYIEAEQMVKHATPEQKYEAGLLTNEVIDSVDERANGKPVYTDYLDELDRRFAAAKAADDLRLGSIIALSSAGLLVSVIRQHAAGR